MRRKVWTFGDVAVFLADAAFRADLLLASTRIYSNLDFAFLVRRWLGNPLDRAAVLEIETAVSLRTLSLLPIGRAGGREMDHSIVSALLFAFESHKLIVFENFAARTADAFLATQGRRWEIAGEQLVQREFPLPAGMLVDYRQVREPRTLLAALKEWDKETYTKRIVQDFYRTAFPQAPDHDHDMEKEILAAWSRGEFFYLRQIARGGAGAGDEVDLTEAIASQAKAQRGPGKTWIEVILLDADEKPVSGAKYQLRITDGSLREGKLDQNGSVRVSGIDAGNCQVSFPEIDANEWKPVSA